MASFVRNMREGLDREGRAVFPIMGRNWLKGLSDQDALAIVAYLRSLSPVNNPMPADQPSFIAKALLALKIVKPQPSITPACGCSAREGFCRIRAIPGEPRLAVCRVPHPPRSPDTRVLSGSAFRRRQHRLWW